MGLIGLTAFDSASRALNKDSNNFVEIAFKNLEELFLKREPITIVTSLKIYPNMVLENLTVERGGGDGASLSFSCSAKQIRIVEQSLIDIPTPKFKRAQPKQKRGSQESPTEALGSAKKSYRSFFKSFFNG